MAPLYESVPPKAYGGTERIVSYLTEELVGRGHQVTLYASADSVTSARLVPCAPMGLRPAGSATDALAYHVLMLEKVFREAGNFDVIHFHVDYLHYPLSRRSRIRQLTTLHGRLDLPELALLYREFRDMPLVSVSMAQRKPLPWANWVGTVYHGLPCRLHSFQAKPDSYLAFVARISPEKRVDRAIDIAQKAGRPLKIMAKIDRVDRDYFEAEIKHLLAKPGVEFLGEGGEEDKEELLGAALALLFPIDWPEPFGLVMIEAFSVGTPVIAFGNGSVYEVVDEGITGFVVDNVAEAARAVDRVGGLDRARMRHVFEERFSAKRMTDDYLALYDALQVQEAISSLKRASRIGMLHQGGVERRNRR